MMTRVEERIVYKLFALLEKGDYVLYSDDEYVIVEVQDSDTEEVFSFKILRESL